MASGKIKGITVEIGGNTTKLGKAIADSEKQARSLQGELKQIDKLLKFDPGNTELLAQKQKLLTEAVSETSQKLGVLKEAEAQVIAQFEKGDIGEDQLRSFQREVIKTEASLGTMRAELEAMDSAVNGFESETDGASSALDELTDKIESQESELTQLKKEYTNVVLEQGKSSKEAKDLRDKMETLNEELKDNKEKLSSAEKQADKYADALDDAGDSADDSGDGFTIMGGALADLTANIISSAVSAIGDLIDSLFELSEATEEYRQMQGKLSGSAETFGYSADFAKGKYEEFYKYLGDDQASTNAITNLMGLGTSTENVSKLAEGAIGVWASYGDSIPIEGLTEAINETVQCGKVTGNFADTINWCKDSNENLNKALSGNKEAQKAYNDAIKEGLPVEDAFNEALAKVTDEQERADIVAQFLNDTYGDSKKTYDELNGSINDANEAELALKETQAELGSTMEPVNTAMTNLKNQALQAIVPLVEKLADGFMNLLSWLNEHPTALTIIKGLVIALATAFGVLATALAIQGIISGVTKAIAFLNTTLLANPIVLIIAAIAGLVAGFIYLWNNCDAFREFWINLWEKIKEAFNIAVEWIKGLIEDIKLKFEEFKGKVEEVINGVVTFFTDGFNSIKTFLTETVPQIISDVVKWFKQLPGKIWSAIKGAISKVATWGTQMWNTAKQKVTTLITGVITRLKQLPGKIWNAIKDAISKVASWGSSLISTAKSKISSMVSSVVSTAKSIPGKIKSAISGAISAVATWGSQMLSKAKSGMTKVVNGITSTLKKVISKVKSIGGDVVKGIWNGISDKVNWIKDKISGFKDAVLKKLKEVFGIKSPSRVMKAEVGTHLASGVAEGFTESDEPTRAIEDFKEDFIDNARNINGITLRRQMETTFTGTMSPDRSILDRLDAIVTKLEGKTKIVLDTGALVGETIAEYDRALSNIKTQKVRGW